MCLTRRLSSHSVTSRWRSPTSEVVRLSGCIYSHTFPWQQLKTFVLHLPFSIDVSIDVSTSCHGKECLCVCLLHQLCLPLFWDEPSPTAVSYWRWAEIDHAEPCRAVSPQPQARVPVRDEYQPVQDPCRTSTDQYQNQNHAGPLGPQRPAGVPLTMEPRL